LLEDIGRGDHTTQALLATEVKVGKGSWVSKASGVIAGLPVAARVFQLLGEQASFIAVAAEGEWCNRAGGGRLHGSLNAL